MTQAPRITYPQSLNGLSTREEIADTVIRATLGLDSNNKALWESSWAADPDITLSAGSIVMKGLESINKDCFDRVGPMDTQHLITGIRIDVKNGLNTAHLTANALAQHYRAGQGQDPNAEFRLGGRTYDIQVVKESDGQWKIKTWVINTIWSQGTQAVFQPA